MLRGFIITAAALLLVILVAAWFAYRFAFYVSPKQKEKSAALPTGEQYEQKYPGMTQLIRKMVADPYEEVWITARDGTRLMGRYYRVQDGAPLQIQFHGYRSNAYRDFCGGHMLTKEMGYNSLVVDQRSHGRSEGTTICFGIRERWDCLDWANYAWKRFGSETPIFLAGVSSSGIVPPSLLIVFLTSCPTSY